MFPHRAWFTPGRYKQIDLRLPRFHQILSPFNVVCPLCFMKAAVVLKKKKRLSYLKAQELYWKRKKMNMNAFEPPTPNSTQTWGSSAEKAVTSGLGQD